MLFDDESKIIRGVAVFFSVSLFLAVPFAGIYTGEMGDIIPGFIRILTSPCTAIADYFRMGNLPATFLNAGLCGLACTQFMYHKNTECEVTTCAGFFLVIAHAFYGLNFLNMWLPILAVFIYCKVIKTSFHDNLAMAFFATSFGPFISELFFRYPTCSDKRIVMGPFSISIWGLILSIVLMLFLAFAIPAILPGAAKLHRGFTLYNAGMAFGLLGMFVFAFLYKTLGAFPSVSEPVANPVYEAHGASYLVFCNVFYLLVFGICILVGYYINGKSFRGYRHLLSDTGHRSNFFQEYGTGCTIMNLGFYGFLMVVYMDLIIALTNGAGFTGPTCGVVLAAMTFAASGQHIRNVWQPLLGYCLLNVIVAGISLLTGVAVPWTVSNQGYIGGAAFATGLCPFSGVYGSYAGILAGVISAILCTSTAATHGGLMLYNGGFTTGITAIILVSLLDHYHKKPLRKTM